MATERILVADDEQFVREICVRAIRELGCQVQAVATGAEAVEVARQQPFDLFLTDLRMPGMSGLEAYREIREFTPDIIGVAMTGYGTMETAIQALQLGFHDFILKPFSPQNVRDAVERALEQRRLREENARLRALIPLYQLTRALMAITSLEELLQKLMEMAKQEANVDMVAVLLFSDLSQELVVRAGLGLDAGAINSRLSVVRESVIRRALETEQPLIWTKDQLADFPFASDVQMLVTIPLMTQGETLGLMVVGKRSLTFPFSYSDMELLSVLAGQAAVAIKNAQLFEEIQRAYRKVEESDYLKSEFIAIASHELRTPLVSILGYIELLTYEAKGEALEHLNIVLEQALRLRDIVNDLMSLVDLKAGMAEITWEEISLKEAIQKVAEDLRPQIEGKGIRLSVEIPGECALMRADYERLRLILSKLISNAVKFSPQGEIVSIKASRESDRIAISISDHGPGISPEAQANLFRPFYQVEESLRRKHGGMGLGLAIAKGMVELHGGEIWVQSNGGHGSTFTFTIPQVQK